MDYEEKYNNLLSAIKELKEANPSDEGIQNWVDDNVPELCESEDERIRKKLISFVENWTIFNPNSPFDDYPIYTSDKSTVDKILAWLKKQNEEAIKEALRLEYEKGKADAIAEDPCRTCDHPTMSCINFPCEKKQAEQKPTEWSEEDERILLRLIAHFDWHGNTRFTKEDCQEATNWLKSLRPQPKNEWSEVDSMHLANAILAAEKEWGVESCTSKWLKSLKPQHHWKPSDEQINDLVYIIERAVEDDSLLKKNLSSLYNELKKLQEE